ncbi:hypothetical protein E4656_19980 [Natronospirillum operosum]|uniref:DUF3800 domain-containing protein n=1 Tax=Natronospirillum operosum TaxID=2759953 RepID=A0A4Z0W6D1_9GAMM|nr:hypothetical protein [Natronospirillum operosum]TGG89396.1 hypothetical protein E4656_19980 [Natronospirillum operosum]
MYVYLDETTFGENNEYSGYACFITKYRIENSVIVEALNNLRADPDVAREQFKEHDSRTLDREYFHAADDSQNGHSHLCRSINKNIVGNFSSHYFKTKEHNFKNTEEAYDLASKLSMLSVLSESDEVTFVFEERNDLTRKYIEKWWDSLWPDILKSQFTYPYIRTFYPVLNYEICSKSDPGLQVVDFILWASTRQVLDKNCPWFNRLECWFKTEIKPESETWGGHSLSFGMNEKDNKETYTITDYQHDNEQLNSFEYQTHYIVNAQKVINLVASLGPQKGVDHFWSEIEFLHNTRVQKSTASHIEKLATCFLKLFDNVTLIKDDTSKEDKAFWLMCRKCFSYALHKHDVGGRMHSIRLSDIRNKIIENDADALQQC